MDVQPTRYVRGAAHDERRALSSFAGEVEGVAILVFGDVLELQVADLADAPARLPQHADECLVAHVLADIDDALDVTRQEQVAALEFLLVFAAHMRGNPAHDSRCWCARGELRRVSEPRVKAFEDGFVRSDGFGAVRRLMAEQPRDELLDIFA